MHLQSFGNIFFAGAITLAGAENRQVENAPGSELVLPERIQSGKKLEQAEQAPIKLKLDPRTLEPIGELVAPRGVLLDPRDIPKQILPHLDFSQGLTGTELTLSGLLARSIGFAVEGAKLPKRYEVASNAMRDNWTQVFALPIETLQLNPDSIHTFAAMYFDTGRRLDRENMEVSVVASPRLALAPIASEKFQEFLTLEKDLALFGPQMPKADAKRLFDYVADRSEGVDYDIEPWFLHGKGQLVFLWTGNYDSELVRKNPFGLTEEGFFEECRKSFRRVLIEQKMPKSEAAQAEGSLYSWEGICCVSRGAAEGKKTVWLGADENLLTYNNASKKPVLWLQIPAATEASSKRFKEVELSMILGAEKRVLYTGGWPLK